MLDQKRGNKNKQYSLHEPHVYCMSKGKAHQRYEFATKASIITTRDSGIVVGALAFEQNTFEGHTVPKVLAQVRRLINRVPIIGIADRGYRGKSKVDDTQIVTPKPARRNTSKEAMALTRKRSRRRVGKPLYLKYSAVQETTVYQLKRDSDVPQFVASSEPSPGYIILLTRQ